MPPGPARPSIGLRPGFAYLKSELQASIAFSDAIRSSITGLQTVAVYVPVRDERQQLLAVLTATLNLEHLTQSFEGLQLPPRSVFYLRRSSDHHLLIRHPPIASELNKPVRSPITERIDAGQTHGNARFQALLDGEHRVYGFRKIEDYPFYVMVGLSEAAVLQVWRQNAAIAAAVVLGLGLVLLLAIGRMARLQRQRLAAQQDAQQAHELLHDAINSISAGITIYGPDGRLVMNNQALRALFEPLRDVLQPGRTFEEITRTGLQRGLYAEAVDDPEAWLARRLRQHQEADGRPYELALADGRWIEFSEHRTPKGYIVGSRIDITQRKRLEAELRELASTDELTGLANRRQFMQRLEEELERLRRQTTRAACVLMLDLDHFKRVNDQHGHDAGDRLLQHFAQLLRQELRSVDTPARMGGEEFAVILPGTDL
ncbi:MAG: diguanylate cyclase, partial [Hylemonella sp.]